MSVPAAGAELLLKDGWTLERHRQLRMTEVMRVIRLYLRFNTAQLGHLPLGSEPSTLKYPALFIEPGPDTSQLEVVGGPYLLKLAGSAHMYFTGTDRTRLVELTMIAEDALRKVFSNNADNDLKTAGRTDRWRANGTLLGTGDTEAAAWHEIATSFSTSKTGKYGRTPEEEVIRSLTMQFSLEAYAIL